MIKKLHQMIGLRNLIQRAQNRVISTLYSNILDVSVGVSRLLPRWKPKRLLDLVDLTHGETYWHNGFMALLGG